LSHNFKLQVGGSQLTVEYCEEADYETLAHHQRASRVAADRRVQSA
jgi:hypothetical protein